jgi:hypothetical protein
MTNNYYFVGGQQGPWKVTGMSAYRGAGLATVGGALGADGFHEQR